MPGQLDGDTAGMHCEGVQAKDAVEPPDAIRDVGVGGLGLVIGEREVGRAHCS